MPFYLKLTESWQVTPPLPVMVAAYLGIGSSRKKPQPQDFEAFLEATGFSG